MSTLLIIVLFAAALVGSLFTGALWLRQEFQKASADTMRLSQDQFMQQATATFDLAQERTQGRLDLNAKSIEQLVAPLRDQVTTLTNQQIALGTQVTGLGDQTSALTQVLGARPARGQWGEDNLRRLVHLAGLTEGVHVMVQQTFTVDGHLIRPDLLVYLAGEEVVIVDAKAPMDAFQKAVNASQREDAARWGKEHAAALKTHIRDLGKKQYARAVPRALDFVVLYLPYEGAIDLAHQYDDGLFEFAAANKVHLATPHTLIPMLNTVALGWQQRKLAESAEQIVLLGTRLYERIGIVADHLAGVGKSLESAGACYNKAVGSVESQLLTTTRELRTLGISSAKAAPELAVIDVTIRPFTKPEMALRAELPAA